MHSYGAMHSPPPPYGGSPSLVPNECVTHTHTHTHIIFLHLVFSFFAECAFKCCAVVFFLRGFRLRFWSQVQHRSQLCGSAVCSPWKWIQNPYPTVPRWWAKEHLLMHFCFSLPTFFAQQIIRVWWQGATIFSSSHHSSFLNNLLHRSPALMNEYQVFDKKTAEEETQQHGKGRTDQPCPLLPFFPGIGDRNR